MRVKSNEVRTIMIEGVAFTPDVKGVPVPDAKIKALKENRFYKHYVGIGAFVEIEEATKKTTKETKAE